ncbi:MAG: hypothetical protein HY689_01020 [Chloroflexi bacterium]|nr:hypothetical protein [Chloroflexota bacterium]
MSETPQAFGDLPAAQQQDVHALSATLVRASLNAANKVSQEWGELPDHVAMSDIIHFTIRTEMLLFLMHMVSRYAFIEFGDAVRTKLQDALVEVTLPTYIETSFGNSTSEWRANMLSALLHHLREAEMDYKRCTALLDESDPTTDDSVVTTLAYRVTVPLQMDDAIVTLSLIRVGLGTLVETDLKKRVQALGMSLAASGVRSG